MRDTVALASCRVGIEALAAIPAKSEKTGAGERDVPATFAGCTFHPGEMLYADDDGIVVSRQFRFRSSLVGPRTSRRVCGGRL